MWWPFRRKVPSAPKNVPPLPVGASGQTIAEITADFDRMNTLEEMNDWCKEYHLAQLRGQAEGYPPNYSYKVDLYVAQLYNQRSSTKFIQELQAAQHALNPSGGQR